MAGSDGVAGRIAGPQARLARHCAGELTSPLGIYRVTAGVVTPVFFIASIALVTSSGVRSRPHHMTRRLLLMLPLSLAQRSAVPKAKVSGPSPPRPTTACAKVGLGVARSSTDDARDVLEVGSLVVGEPPRVFDDGPFAWPSRARDCRAV